MLPFLFESIASSQEFGNWFVYVTLIITKFEGWTGVLLRNVPQLTLYSVFGAREAQFFTVFFFSKSM